MKRPLTSEDYSSIMIKISEIAFNIEEYRSGYSSTETELCMIELSMFKMYFKMGFVILVHVFSFRDHSLTKQ